jgi:pSer/pThr/pTyr-binding forkhead associated (FHA) protein
MKISLKITTPAGQSSLFEHTGPVIRIGRDPACELLLEGDDAGKAASRLHARIELAADAASLIDTGSANKTLHNTTPIERPVTLRAGDEIQIGFTGATLTVLDVDLTPPRAQAQDRERRSAAPILLAVGGGGAVCLALVCTVVFWPRRPPSEPLETDTPAKPVPSPVPSVVQNHQGQRTKETPAAATSRALPSVEVKSVGHYLRSGTTRPSVLVQRTGENYPWTVLRSGQAVSTANALVSLPGYESLVSLGSGLRLNLWGSLPEFGAPVLESAIMLNNPALGVDVDFTLDRGRVEIDGSNHKGPARIRIRFLREVWDVVLLERGSKVCAELWHTQARSPDGEVVRCFGLFSRGKVSIKTGRKELAYSAPARTAWSSAQPERVFEKKLAAPPAWWEKPPPPSPAASDALLSLGDWVKRLDQSPHPIETIMTVVGESADRTDRLLGLWFLAALDEVPHLIDFLRNNDPAHADIRSTAAYGLRDWLARNGPQRDALTRQIKDRLALSPSNAALVVSMLAPISAKASEDPATYQTLISHLNHDRLEVRHLAAMHLYAELKYRMPKDALAIDYNPTDEPDKRRQAVAKWHALIPPGKLPVRPLPPP